MRLDFEGRTRKGGFCVAVRLTNRHFEYLGGYNVIVNHRSLFTKSLCRFDIFYNIQKCFCDGNLGLSSFIDLEDCKF